MSGGRSGLGYRQAYLVMAHRDDLVFRTLLSMLDRPYNHLFVHMDRKCAGYRQDEVESLMHHAKLTHTRRMDVRWGADSQIRAELLLLSEATARGSYDRYHLISGQDLPIQTQDTIREFMQVHSNKEFVGFAKPAFSYAYRVRFYYPMLRLPWPRQSVLRKAMVALGIGAQTVVGVRRNSHICFQMGDNWFSITDGFARYVLSQGAWLKHVFRSTYCADEVFLQTLALNSEYEDRLYRPTLASGMALPSSMRLIDWDRGSPYVFKAADWPQLKVSSRLFARKFDGGVDSMIIQLVRSEYSV
ncbi:MAG: hypothetical protein LBV06_06175 [Propionibacteriaceae bacterium]|jgi:hypothetical protein|nr:hypothetical protein [Propionibacteriaceae bacterium]